MLRNILFLFLIFLAGCSPHLGFGYQEKPDQMVMQLAQCNSEIIRQYKKLDIIDSRLNDVELSYVQKKKLKEEKAVIISNLNKLLHQVEQLEGRVAETERGVEDLRATRQNTKNIIDEMITNDDYLKRRTQKKLHKK